MSFHLIIVKQAPYQGRSSHEIAEAIMSLALFDVEHRIVFFESGLTWLLKHQNPSTQKSMEKQLNALPIYGCDEIYHCADHHSQIVGDAELNDIADPVTVEQLSQWMRSAKQVEVF